MRRRLALTAVLVAALTACADAPGTFTEEERMDARTELAGRPTLEQARARYGEMQQLLRDRLDAALGPMQWTEFEPPAQGTCGFAFPLDLGGRTTTLGIIGFDAPIPDPDWPRARDIITTTAATYGFTTDDFAIDTPGHHVLSGTDPTLGARYSLITQAATTFSLTTGCHLPATH